MPELYRVKVVPIMPWPAALRIVEGRGGCEVRWRPLRRARNHGCSRCSPLRAGATGAETRARMPGSRSSLRFLNAGLSGLRCMLARSQKTRGSSAPSTASGIMVARGLPCPGHKRSQPVSGSTDRRPCRVFRHASTAPAPARAACVIDPEQIARAIGYYPMNAGRMVPEVLRLVGALQTSDRDGIACPVSRHPGDDVIQPAEDPDRAGRSARRRHGQADLVPGDQARHRPLVGRTSVRAHPAVTRGVVDNLNGDVWLRKGGRVVTAVAQAWVSVRRPPVLETFFGRLEQMRVADRLCPPLMLGMGP
jgi:hypothetical protein